MGIAGLFLEHQHTARHYRSELFSPSRLFRRRREDWQAEGSPKLEERAERTAEALMHSEVDSGLNAEQSEELNRRTEGYLRQVESG